MKNKTKVISCQGVLETLAFFDVNVVLDFKSSFISTGVTVVKRLGQADV